MTELKQHLESLKNMSHSKRQQGLFFEKLMQAFLLEDKEQQQRFDQVWLWSEWAEQNNQNKQDIGIDLVAKDCHDGSLCAIQCKFYDQQHTLQKADIDSFFTASGKSYADHHFSNRLIISTTDNWTKHAEDALKEQKIPCSRLGVQDLTNSSIRDWGNLYKPQETIQSDTSKKNPRSHQRDAIDAVVKGLEESDQGQLIMACGTGKTLTALWIMQEYLKTHEVSRFVLFLVPSLALLSQTMKEWIRQTSKQIRVFAVCSDVKVGKNDEEDIQLHDLVIPPTTDASYLARQLKVTTYNRVNIVFSTYQSLKVIQQAQDRFQAPEFDLVICDEAHRTTGVDQITHNKTSPFQLIHDKQAIQAKKRLYMTATPRLYAEPAKAKAKQLNIEVFSMDDEAVYGKELYRLDFSRAIEKDLLTDYKVIVLTVLESEVSQSFQNLLATEDLKLDDLAKLFGCWSALAKKVKEKKELADPDAMQRAVAFCKDIKTSRLIEKLFGSLAIEFQKHQADSSFKCEASHVDGTMNAFKRSEKLRWLEDGTEKGVCRILSNARCLSEGVDVPSLDAVIFMNPRKSQVDVVQAVGRVMRKAEGKNYGYIILPVVIPAGIDPEESLNNNKTYQVVWQVLQALRSHDDRFNAMINTLELNNKKPDNLVIGTPEISNAPEQQLIPFSFEKLKDVIYAKVVLKCGDRKYWEDWASDVAKIAKRHIERINNLIATNDNGYQDLFQEFLTSLKQNINPSIDENEAIEMLAQHMMTKPVFNALFQDYDFAKNNPISQSMQTMIDLLEDQGLDNENNDLDKFYQSVQRRVENVDNLEGKQRIIIELYDKFFKLSFPKVTERLGIVYTPVECVDFILNSVQCLLQQEFGKTLSCEDVNILDPFTGTGTFITRLLQNEDLIKTQDLKRKYESELHANEIVLLAYYIATINIESAYYFRTQETYQPFKGAVLTDTFQMSESQQNYNDKIFQENHDRIKKQDANQIQVIIGNPPYSAGQRSANDNNQNIKYESLDDKIENSYVKHCTLTNKNSLYDSYIRAIKWGSERLQSGIMALITNAGWLDSNSADGMRKCLQQDFTSIYVFHLRGNQRTSGETSRKEGGKIFGQGSRTPIAITFFVKNPHAKKQGQIYFHDIGDYLNRDEKLKIIKDFQSIKGINWQTIIPDKYHDWLDQRDDSFNQHLQLGNKKDKSAQTIFKSYSLGLASSRDAWVYHSSKIQLATNIQNTIEFYNSELQRWQDSDKNQDIKDFANNDTAKISWNHNFFRDLEKQKTHDFESQSLVPSLYRPFQKQWCYFNRSLNHSVYQQPQIFPTAQTENIVICVSGIGATHFSVLISNLLPDLEIVSKSQCFPLYWYEKQEGSLFAEKQEYKRTDGITDFALKDFQEFYQTQNICKEDIFYYIYAVLHHEDYQQRFANNLVKQLPRIPKVKTYDDFQTFSKIGFQLADLHLNYEEQTEFPIQIETTTKQPQENLTHEQYRVDKMQFAKLGKEKDKSTIIYNEYMTIKGIPLDAYNYVIGGKSAIEWVMERQVIKTHKDSQITNDANLYATETMNNPRYPLQLLLKVINVSMKTIKLVKDLPTLQF